MENDSNNLSSVDEEIFQKYQKQKNWLDHMVKQAPKADCILKTTISEWQHYIH